MCRGHTTAAQNGTACSSSDARARLLQEDNVEDILEDGLTDVQDFQGLLATRPKRVIKWLQEYGMEKLGEFDVQVCDVRGCRSSNSSALSLVLTGK